MKKRDTDETLAPVITKTFAIVNLTTWRHGGTFYTSRKRAEAAAKKLGVADDNHKVMSYPEWLEGDVTVEVVNLMSGRTVGIKRSDRGTCCDPSTERYWSM